MLEAKLAQNNLNFKCSFMFFLVRARFGPKTGGGANFAPPPNEKRCKKCLMKLGLMKAVETAKLQAILDISHLLFFDMTETYVCICLT